MSDEYSVIFTGEIIEGLDIDLVKNNIAVKMKLSGEQVNKLFEAAPRSIKKFDTQDKANELVAAFKACGAIVEIERQEDILQDLDLPDEVESDNPTEDKQSDDDQIELDSRSSVIGMVAYSIIFIPVITLLLVPVFGNAMLAMSVGIFSGIFLSKSISFRKHKNPPATLNKYSFVSAAIIVGVVIILGTVKPLSNNSINFSSVSSSDKSSRPLTQNEQSIVQELKNASTMVRKNISSTVYISFQPDSLSDSGDCHVVIRGSHSNWNITYQLVKGGNEAIHSQSQMSKGASFRLKGDSSNEIITFDSQFGSSSMGVPSRSSSFNPLVNILSSSNTVKIDYGNLGGRGLTDTYNPTGFSSGYRIVQELCI